MYRIILLVFLFLFSLRSFSQDPDSLKLALDNASHDTTRCKILSELIESGFEDEVWIRYNEDLRQICLKGIDDKTLGTFYSGYLAYTLNNYGYYHMQYYRYATAESFYKQALAREQKNKNTPGIAAVFNNLGYLFRQQGNISKALNYYHQALKLQLESNDLSGLGASYNNIGYIFENQKQHAKALEYYNRSLETYVKKGDKAGIAGAYSNIAYIYKSEGDLNCKCTKSEALKKGKILAVDFLNKALRLRQEINDPKGVADDLNLIGQLMISESKNCNDSMAQAAEVNLYKALKIRREIDYKGGQADSYNTLGEFYLGCGDLKKAESYARQGLAVSKEIRNPEKIMDGALLLYNILDKTGNYKEALNMHVLFLQMRDSILNENTKQDALKKTYQLDYEKKALADSIKGGEEKRVLNAEIRQQRSEKITLFAGIALVALLSVYIYYRFAVTRKQKLVIEQKEKETHEQKLIIEEKHKEITDSINYAERIQRSFLATKETLDANLEEYFILFRPKDVVSGDFYWASQLNNGNFAFVTADSTGHGVPGAIMSLLNITSIEKAVEYSNDPAEILNAARKTIIERLKKDGSAEGGKDGMDCSIIVFDHKANELQIASANNPVWIIRSNELIEIKPDKMPVGKSNKEDVSFTLHRIPFQKGTLVYTLTDGFPDQFGLTHEARIKAEALLNDPSTNEEDRRLAKATLLNGKKFMSKKLKELIMANAHLPMREQQLIFDKAFTDWKGSREQTDDVTLVGIRI